MKYILKDTDENDPIFKQGFIISQHKLEKIDLVKIPKSLSSTEKIKHLTKSFIKLGWKYTRDK